MRQGAKSMAREEVPTAEAYRELKAQAAALAKALKSLPFPRCYDRDCIEVGVNEGNWITFKDGHTEPHKKDCPRYVIHAALASYASNPAEARG
jgi:hypothetical protein